MTTAWHVLAGIGILATIIVVGTFVTGAAVMIAAVRSEHPNRPGEWDRVGGPTS
jgi:hypothetical protein